MMTALNIKTRGLNDLTKCFTNLDLQSLFIDEFSKDYEDLNLRNTWSGHQKRLLARLIAHLIFNGAISLSLKVGNNSVLGITILLRNLLLT